MSNTHTVTLPGTADDWVPKEWVIEALGQFGYLAYLNRNVNFGGTAQIRQSDFDVTIRRRAESEAGATASAQPPPTCSACRNRAASSNVHENVESADSTTTASSGPSAGAAAPAQNPATPARHLRRQGAAYFYRDGNAVRIADRPELIQAAQESAPAPAPPPPARPLRREGVAFFYEDGNTLRIAGPPPGPLYGAPANSGQNREVQDLLDENTIAAALAGNSAAPPAPPPPYSQLPPAVRPDRRVGGVIIEHVAPAQQSVSSDSSSVSQEGSASSSQERPTPQCQRDETRAPSAGGTSAPIEVDAGQPDQEGPRQQPPAVIPLGIVQPPPIQTQRAPRAINTRKRSSEEDDSDFADVSEMGDGTVDLQPGKKKRKSDDGESSSSSSSSSSRSARSGKTKRFDKEARRMRKPASPKGKQV